MRVVVFALLIVFCNFQISTAAQTAGNTTQIISESPSGIEIALSTIDYEIKSVEVNHREYSEIVIPGFERIGEEGKPDMPAITHTFIVPPRTGISLRAVSDKTSISSAYPVKMYSESESSLATPLSSTELFPPEIVKMHEPAIFRGYRLASFTYYPFQWDSKNQEFIKHENIIVSLDFDDSAVNPFNPVTRDEPLELTYDSYKFLKALTQNPPRRDDNGETLPRGGYMLVVAENIGEDNEYVQKLADWKRACGHYVEVIESDEADDDFREDFVEPAYEEWDHPLETICLVGDYLNLRAFGNRAGADIKLGFVEGNDKIADIGVCRLKASSGSMAKNVINRSLEYQSNPWMEETDWLTKAGAVGENVSGWTKSVDYTMEWVAEAEKRAGYQSVELDLGGGSGQQSGMINDWLRDDNMGAVFIRGRSFPNNASSDPVYPIVLGASGHGEYLHQSFWGLGSLNSPKGPSVSSCTWDNPNTLSCNILIGGMARGLLVDKLNVGWSQAFAIAMLDRVDANFDYHVLRYELFGEAGQTLWCGVPTETSVSHPDEIDPNTNRLSILVEDEDLEIGIPNALVTITKPEELLTYGFTDEDGFCVLRIDPDDEDELTVTVTGEDILPYTSTIEIEESEVFISASITEIDDSDGNDDGTGNPGETILLSIRASNSGYRRDATEVVGTVISSSPWVDVITEEISFGDIDSEESVDSEDDVEIVLSESLPSGADLGLSIRLSSNEGSWHNMLDLDHESSRLVISNQDEFGAIGALSEELEIELSNIGVIDSPDLHVELISMSWEIKVDNSISEVNSIEPDGVSTLSGDPLTVHRNPQSIPGTPVQMYLLISTEEGQPQDSIEFKLIAGEADVNTPLGPDDYGYTCYDDEDEGWFYTPEYDWIEISRLDDDRDYSGQAITDDDLRDNFVVEIDLPFTFIYYGEEFDKASVSENGFLAMGEGLDDLGQYDNYALDESFSGSFGMIAPYWDDLRLRGDESGIYSYHIENEGVFIVEWYNVPSGNNNFHFQIIFYDPEDVHTVTGDGIFKIQYKNFPDNVRAGNIPKYGSVGISSPCGKYGLDYFSNDEYPETSAELTGDRAISFAAIAPYRPGALVGYVKDYETGDPIQGALVEAEYGFMAITDEDGYWFFNDALAEEPVWLKASMPGYNDSTKFDILVDEYDTLDVNFELLHPEFVTSTMQIETMLDSGLTVEFPFTITNEGNGPLDWKMEKHLPGNADAEPWEFRMDFNVGEETENPRLNGVVFANNEFYVSGRRRNNDETHKILVFSSEGELERDFDQPDQDDNKGAADLTWDKDEEILWCSGSRKVYGISTDGDSITSFTPDLGGRSSIQSLAWDSDREVLWLSSIVSDIIAVTPDGERVASLDRQDLKIYGLAYWYDAPDDYKLIILNQDTEGPVTVYKMNPETGDTAFVRKLEREDGPPIDNGGIFATNQFDVYSWVLLHLANDGSDDRIDVWQLAGRTDWFGMFENEIEADSGHLETEEYSNYTIAFNTNDLPEETVFEGMLEFFHNAEGLGTIIEVELEVIGERPPSAFNLLEPVNGDTINPVFEDSIRFAWEQSIDPNYGEDPIYVLSFESDGVVNSIEFINGELSFENSLEQLAELIDISLEVEFPLSWWVTVVSGSDTVECTERFLLRFAPNNIRNDGQIPVEFGIHSIYPSPFNAKTAISFGLPESRKTSFAIYNILGRKVYELSERDLESGMHRLIWDANNMPSGLYLARIESHGKTDMSKMSLIR